MAGLSPAARGKNRGALELLKHPPSFFMSMKVDEKYPLPAVHTYSLLGTVGAWSAFFAVAETTPTLFPFLLLIVTLAISSVFAVFTLGAMTDDDSLGGKGRITEAIRSTAKKAANGDMSVSLSESIERAVGYYERSYVEQLSEKQQRWIAQQWETEFAAAVEAKKPQPKIVAGKINSLVDPERIERITATLGALKSLQDTSKPLAEIESFEKQMKALERH